MKDPLLRDCRYLNPSSSSSSLMNYNNGMTRSTISTSESGQELWPIGVKLGIVRLGYSAGKLKYTLVDEQDIVLAREYTFEARLEVLNHGNSNNFNNVSGGGAVVFAYAYQTNHHSTSIINDDNSQMILLQDLIWRRHYGPIPDNKRVVHRNHISMDNRLDNLCLLDLGSNDDNVTTHSTSNNNFDSQAEVNSASRCFDFRGNSINDQESSSESSISYFECHYGPCVRIERCPREFSICGRCQETRYCVYTKQQRESGKISKKKIKFDN
ncbi:zinc finger domain-containing protein 26 [Dermatophagoides farinae]|uniref:Zinc finger domain-containing protein 26 n=1 Tax=Dermatophagoides farinae TaxID=6954 RepID=A0A9D4NP18_DERFA|nr:zinc finger domain-containing protein 26 [Dermatophagoides farinae]